MLARAFHHYVLSRRWVTFMVLGASFLVFGAATVNLFNLLNANLAFIARHGVMALAEGAASQLIELLLTGYVSMLAYVVFKSCEYALVHGLMQAPDTPD